MCVHRKTTESSYAVLTGTPADPSLVYCGLHTSTLERTNIMEGVPLSTPDPATVSSNIVSSSTQCMCSREVTVLSGEKECLDFKRAEAGKAICNVRVCRTGGEAMICDAAGTSVCSHETEARLAYVRSGGDSMVPGEAKCLLINKNVASVTCIGMCP